MERWKVGVIVGLSALVLVAGTVVVTLQLSSRDTRSTVTTAVQAAVAEEAHRTDLALRAAFVAACERGRADRLDNVKGWRTARRARAAGAADRSRSQSERVRDAVAASDYTETVQGLRSRLVDCQSVIPQVPPIPTG